jgi:preprotein translocase subunit SecA
MMDALREGIGLRAYGQRDPLVEYQHEAYAMFRDMVASVKADSVAMLLRIQPAAQAQPVSVFARTPHQELHPAVERAVAQPGTQDARLPGPPLARAGAGKTQDTILQPARELHPAAAPRVGPKVGRNDPCPCGSGLKYKRCHGK